MSKNANLLIGIALIAGAYWYARRKNQVVQLASAKPLGAGSMPASVGTGASQMLGGLLGNLLAPKSGGGTSTGAPVTNSAMDQFPGMTQDAVIQNSIPAADPLATFNPGGLDDMSMWLA